MNGTQRPARLAIEGCGHGTLSAIYASIQKGCEERGWDGVDLVIIGGDFQAVRNSLDMNCMAVPVKFRELGDFHRYYSGEKIAPFPTIFVGGNHEASNHLFELFYGGWVAPNIYYMGAANVLRLGPLRIAGLSGIWKGYDYRKPHFERLPYNNDDVRSIYHVREIDTRRLLQIRTQVDISVSHDWPNGIEWLGDHRWLFQKKNGFREDAQQGRLGSIAAKIALDHLRPRYWFAAHLHVKYAAIVKHSDTNQEPEGKQQNEHAAPDAENDAVNHNEDEIDLDIDTEDTVRPTEAPVQPSNTDEIDLDMDDDSEPTTIPPNPQTKPTKISEDLRAQLPASFAKPPEPLKLPDPPTTITNRITNFLALDKCLPHRNFLQLLEVPVAPGSSEPQTHAGDYVLSYDPEWLAITRVFASSILLGNEHARTPPDLGRAAYLPQIEAAEAWIAENIVAKDRLRIPNNFSRTAPTEAELGRVPGPHEMPREYNNSQTAAFCDLLQIPNPFALSDEEIDARIAKGPRPSSAPQMRGGRGRGRGGGGRGGRGRGGFRGRGR